MEIIKPSNDQFFPKDTSIKKNSINKSTIDVSQMRKYNVFSPFLIKNEHKKLSNVILPIIMKNTDSKIKKHKKTRSVYLNNNNSLYNNCYNFIENKERYNKYIQDQGSNVSTNSVFENKVNDLLTMTKNRELAKRNKITSHRESVLDVLKAEKARENKHSRTIFHKIIEKDICDYTNFNMDFYDEDPNFSKRNISNPYNGDDNCVDSIFKLDTRVDGRRKNRYYKILSDNEDRIRNNINSDLINNYKNIQALAEKLNLRKKRIIKSLDKTNFIISNKVRALSINP